MIANYSIRKPHEEEGDQRAQKQSDQQPGETFESRAHEFARRRIGRRLAGCELVCNIDRAGAGGGGISRSFLGILRIRWHDKDAIPRRNMQQELLNSNANVRKSLRKPRPLSSRPPPPAPANERRPGRVFEGDAREPGDLSEIQKPAQNPCDPKARQMQKRIPLRGGTSGR